ncbi:MAG: hypothetical protein LHW60_03680 [Candidatus Cloacimonetes bacterium]|nr:hypothetical protein [Candidatus Cloacimonadota bacterium]
MTKRLYVVLLFCLMAFGSYAQEYRTRIMEFENPGSRRIHNVGDAKHWYYRSKPEKSMTLKTEGAKRIQIRSFSLERLKKPQIILVIDKKRQSFDLTYKEFDEGYHVYEYFEADIPEGTKSIEVLCYQRSMYMRVYEMQEVLPKAKPKTPRLPNRQILAHAGMIDMTHNSTTSEYYAFNPTQAFRFKHNNARNAIVYVRARLTDRTLPVFGLYQDGELIEMIEFSLARTNKYTAQGVKYLSTGKKLDLPENSGSSEFELRALSDHLFMARPVFISE